MFCAAYIGAKLAIFLLVIYGLSGVTLLVFMKNNSLSRYPFAIRLIIFLRLFIPST